LHFELDFIRDGIQMKTHIQDRQDRQDRFIALVGIITTAIALIAMLGLITGWTILASVRSEYMPMPMISAIIFSAFGIIIHRFNRAASSKWVSIASGVLILIMITGVLLVLDAFYDIFPGSQASPYIGLFFAIFSLLCLLKKILPPGKLINNIISITGVILLCFGFTIVLAYLVGTPLLYGKEPVPIALNGGVCVMLLSLGIISACGEENVVLRLFAGNGPNAKIQRKIVPLVFGSISMGSLFFVNFHDIRGVNYAIISAGGIILVSLVSVIIVQSSVETILNDATKNYEENKLYNFKISELNNSLEQRVADRTKQASDLNRELESFSYSVSHDLRSPLRGIDGWSLALFEDYSDKLDAKGVEYINTIRKETQRMSSLIDDLIKLSHLSRSELKYSVVDLSKLASAIAGRLGGVDPARKLEFLIEPGLVVTGDSGLLEVVLSNLFENSYKFTGTRAKAIIEFGLDKEKEGEVFYVKDNGVGFDMAYAGKLFGAFQRMHKHSEYPGTGIGLATVRRVITLLNGTIWAESKIDEGATFYFNLRAQ